MTRLGVSSYHSDNDDYESFNGVVKALRPKSILFHFEDIDEDKWIPRSVCSGGGDNITAGTTEIEIARWFCEKERLV